VIFWIYKHLPWIMPYVFLVAPGVYALSSIRLILCFKNA